MKKISIDRYTGYRHNRYDEYNSSRGILAACGGTPTADCFADADDYNIDDDIFTGKTPINWTVVLYNLDITADELSEIESGEEKTVVEYWGGEPIKIVFSGAPDRIVKINDSEFVANY